MPAVSNVSSFRKMTEGMLASQRLAMSNDIPGFEKSEVAIALKRASQPLGLTPTAYHVLDILLGLSKPADWKGDNRPVVAISNEKLAAYVGRSERTVIRAIKQLVEARILAYRDSSTGRRWVHRNDQGQVTYAYGLDFTPARIRYREIKRLADEWQANLNADREARREVIRFSRAIVDAMEMSEGVDCTDFNYQLKGIMKMDEGAREKAIRLGDLYDLLLERITETDSSRTNQKEKNNTSSEHDINVTPILNTTNPDSYTSNRAPAKADEITLKSNAANRGEEAPEKEQAEATVPKYSGFSGRTHPEKRNFNHSGVLDSVSISLLETACTAVRRDFGVSFSSWQDLAAAAEIMRMGIGLSQAGYAQACGQLGRQAAAAILAVVAEKALRDPEKISSPGGYFRACCDRALEGKLALARSLFGLAQ